MSKRTTIAVLCGLTAMLAVAADDKQDAGAKDAKVAPWWAYQPVQRPAEPPVKQKQWARTPIDKYILAQLEAKGIKPSPDADRTTLIRRATLDAWGVIPTPEEVKVFVNDR